ncbi:MAG: hypothetical protein ACLRI7_15590 [Ruthenibacterium lactatiformans]
MKKMKRILSLVLVLVMAAGLAACGGEVRPVQVPVHRQNRPAARER